MTGKEISRKLNPLLKGAGGLYDPAENPHGWLHFNFNAPRGLPVGIKGMVDHILIDTRWQVIHFCEVKGDGDSYSPMQEALASVLAMMTDETPFFRYWLIEDADQWQDVVNYRP